MLNRKIINDCSKIDLLLRFCSFGICPLKVFQPTQCAAIPSKQCLNCLCKWLNSEATNEWKGDLNE